MKRFEIRKKVGIFCLAAITVWQSILPVQAATGVNVTYRTQEEIQEYAKEDGVTIKDPLEFAEEPVASAPFQLGKLSDQTLESAVKMLNQIRYIAGLSYDVTISQQYCELTQAAALSNYANKKLSHFPEQPEGMSDEMYQMAQTGASSSNIAWASWPNRSLNETTVMSWMEDGDASNITTLGHRRWMINPSMASTGFGAVSGSRGTYSAVYAFDRSNRDAKEYGVMWPAQNMPVEYFNTEFPWSISMNDEVDSSTVQVTLTRKSDGKKWRFSQTEGEFYVNNDYYGQPGCIIFRPDAAEIGSYQDGDSYDVQITGLSNEDVAYTVNFFSLYKEDQVTLDKDHLTLKEGGKTAAIEASVSTGSENLIWEITDRKVAKMDVTQNRAIVTPLAAGEAEILVKNTKGEILAVCSVIVEHVPGEDASCTAPQLCKICGAVLKPASDHTLVKDEAVPATCTKEGKTEGSHCSVCGEITQKQNTTPKLGHRWEQEQIVPATVTEDGWISRSCSRCAVENREEISHPSTITLSQSNFTYDGQEKRPKITVTAANGSIIDSKFYTVSYQDNVNVGNATAVVTLKENYTGTMTKKFTIQEPGNTEPLENISGKANVKLDRSSFTYNGKSQKPGIVVKMGKKKLVKNRDYKVTYKDNKNVGTASVVVKGTGKYTGKITKKFEICPAGTSISGKITAKSKGFVVKWKKQSKCTAGYQIQYSTSSKFTKKATTLRTVKKASTTSLTVKKLKAKKTYYIRIRTYQKVKGETYGSGWSKSKKVTTKK